MATSPWVNRQGRGDSSSASFIDSTPSLRRFVEEWWLEVCDFFVDAQCAGTVDEMLVLSSRLPAVEKSLNHILQALLIERDAYFSDVRSPAVPAATQRTVYRREPVSPDDAGTLDSYGAEEDDVMNTGGKYGYEDEGNIDYMYDALHLDFVPGARYRCDDTRYFPPCYQYFFHVPAENDEAEIDPESEHSSHHGSNTSLQGGHSSRSPEPTGHDGGGETDPMSHPVSIGTSFLLMLCMYAKHDNPTGARRVILRFLTRLLGEADLMTGTCDYGGDALPHRTPHRSTRVPSQDKECHTDPRHRNKSQGDRHSHASPHNKDSRTPIRHPSMSYSTSAENPHGRRAGDMHRRPLRQSIIQLHPNAFIVPLLDMIRRVGSLLDPTRHEDRCTRPAAAAAAGSLRPQRTDSLASTITPAPRASTSVVTTPVRQQQSRRPSATPHALVHGDEEGGRGGGRGRVAQELDPASWSTSGPKLTVSVARNSPGGSTTPGSVGPTGTTATATRHVRDAHSSAMDPLCGQATPQQRRDSLDAGESMRDITSSDAVGMCRAEANPSSATNVASACATKRRVVYVEQMAWHDDRDVAAAMAHDDAERTEFIQLVCVLAEKTELSPHLATFFVTSANYTNYSSATHNLSDVGVRVDDHIRGSDRRTDENVGSRESTNAPTRTNPAAPSSSTTDTPLTDPAAPHTRPDVMPTEDSHHPLPPTPHTRTARHSHSSTHPPTPARNANIRNSHDTHSGNTENHNDKDHPSHSTNSGSVLVLLHVLLPYLTHDCSSAGWRQRRETCRHALSAVLSLAKCADAVVQDLVAAERGIAARTLTGAITTVLTLCKVPQNDDSEVQLRYLTDVLKFWSALQLSAPVVAEALGLRRLVDDFVRRAWLPLLQSRDAHVYAATCLVGAAVLHALHAQWPVMTATMAQAMLYTAVQTSTGRAVMCAGATPSCSAHTPPHSVWRSSARTESGAAPAMTGPTRAGDDDGLTGAEGAGRRVAARAGPTVWLTDSAPLGRAGTRSFFDYYIVPHLTVTPTLSAEDRLNRSTLHLAIDEWTGVQSTLMLISALVKCCPDVFMRGALDLDLSGMGGSVAAPDTESAAMASLPRLSAARLFPPIVLAACFSPHLRDGGAERATRTPSPTPSGATETGAAPRWEEVRRELAGQWVGNEVLELLLGLENRTPAFALRARSRAMQQRWPIQPNRLHGKGEEEQEEVSDDAGSAATTAAASSHAAAETATAHAFDDSGRPLERHSIWFHDGVHEASVMIGLCELLGDAAQLPTPVVTLLTGVLTCLCVLPDLRVLYTLLDARRGRLHEALCRLRAHMDGHFMTRVGALPLLAGHAASSPAASSAVAAAAVVVVPSSCSSSSTALAKITTRWTGVSTLRRMFRTWTGIDYHEDQQESDAHRRRTVGGSRGVVGTPAASGAASLRRHAAALPREGARTHVATSSLIVPSAAAVRHKRSTAGSRPSGNRCAADSADCASATGQKEGPRVAARASVEQTTAYYTCRHLYRQFMELCAAHDLMSDAEILRCLLQAPHAPQDPDYVRSVVDNLPFLRLCVCIDLFHGELDAVVGYMTLSHSLMTLAV